MEDISRRTFSIMVVDIFNTLQEEYPIANEFRFGLVCNVGIRDRVQLGNDIWVGEESLQVCFPSFLLHL